MGGQSKVVAVGNLLNDGTITTSTIYNSKLTTNISDCGSTDWDPNGMLCDSKNLINSPFAVSNQGYATYGPNWENVNPGGTIGYVVIDAAKSQVFATFIIFQMFDDYSKVSDIELFIHPENGNTFPLPSDSNWSSITNGYVAIDSGELSRDGTIEAPTRITPETAVTSRYLLLKVKNSGSQGWIGVRSIKAFAEAPPAHP